MLDVATPSRLYRVYWAGRYLERIDLVARSLLAAAGEYFERGSEEALRRLSSSLGLSYEGATSTIERLLYDESLPSSILHAARMVRMNMFGLGIERILREANILVLTAENRVDPGDWRALRGHLEDLISAAARLGKVVEEEFTEPPTPPASVLREQLLHQQQ